MKASISRNENLSPESGNQVLLAGFYAMSLRQEGYSVAEAAKLVILRYPSVRPHIERLTREVVDPLTPLEKTG